MQLRHFVPPLFVLFVVGGLILSSMSAWVRRLWVLVLLTYGLAILIASVVAAHRTGVHRAWLLPVAFPILHFSYGVGVPGRPRCRFARRSRPTPAVAGPEARIAPQFVRLMYHDVHDGSPHPDPADLRHRVPRAREASTARASRDRAVGTPRHHGGRVPRRPGAGGQQRRPAPSMTAGLPAHGRSVQ